MMYKDREKQKAKGRERIRRYREKEKGVTKEAKGVTDSLAGIMMTKLCEEIPSKGVTVSDILDKLTDLFWRGRLEKICNAFKNSHHPSYVNDVWLGDYNLSHVCELLEVTG